MTTSLRGHAGAGAITLLLKDAAALPILIAAVRVAAAGKRKLLALPVVTRRLIEALAARPATMSLRPVPCSPR